MAILTGAIDRPARQATSQVWLHSRGWDLTFLIFSIAVAFIPYSIYLVFGGKGLESAAVKGTDAYNARIFVNNLVAVFIGGPHMYATFTRTVMDPAFLRRRGLFVASSIAVPIAVFTMAVSSYATYVWLLSVFFALASLHALQQIVWLTEAYNRKARLALSWQSRAIDYGVVLTSLYPIATFKMVQGAFKIGPVALKYNEIVYGWNWLAWLVSLAFAAMLLLWIAKTVLEFRAGYGSVPKTLLIGLTLLLMFWTPLFPNMDTAFQGVNTWHSFQYLALTWYANHLREQRSGRRLGFMHWLSALAQTVRERAQAARGSASRLRAGLVALVDALRRVDRESGWASFYMLCMALLPVSGILIMSATWLWPNLHPGMPGADEAYAYMGILSILIVHYVHDAVLFTDSDALVER